MLFYVFELNITVSRLFVNPREIICMKLKYLREVLGCRQNYCCNDYSCSLPVNTDENENMQDARIQVSKFNVPFDFGEINKGSIVVKFTESSADN
jgi:hypothetical protein